MPRWALSRCFSMSAPASSQLCVADALASSALRSALRVCSSSLPISHTLSISRPSALCARQMAFVSSACRAAKSTGAAKPPAMRCVVAIVLAALLHQRTVSPRARDQRSSGGTNRQTDNCQTMENTPRLPQTRPLTVQYRTARGQGRLRHPRTQLERSVRRTPVALSRCAVLPRSACAPRAACIAALLVTRPCQS